MDNIIITQEVFHSMRTIKRKKWYMALKNDLEKAYDRLSWSFLNDTLSYIGLPNHLVSLILSCVSSPSMSILFNGVKLSNFTPSRGLR